MNDHPLRYLARLILTILLAAGLTSPAAASLSVLQLGPPVTNSVGATDGAATWADFDNDDRLDVIVSGATNEGAKTMLLLNKTSGSNIILSEWSTALEHAELSSTAAGDFNNDGILDVLLTGSRFTQQLNGYARVYRGAGSQTFTLHQSLPGLSNGIYRGTGLWADIDRDGDLDILISGYQPGLLSPFTALYRNDGPPNYNFSQIASPSLPALGDSAAAFADYDGDGLLDLALSGMSASGPRTLILHNDGEMAFSAVVINPALVGVYQGALSWVDTNLDGRLDLFVTGNAGTDAAPQAVTRVYGNTLPVGGTIPTFAVGASNPGLLDLSNTSASWADYDLDGDPDLLIAGTNSPKNYSRLYSNINGGFIDVQAQAPTNLLPSGLGLSTAWGDINNDHAPDALITGMPYDPLDPNGFLGTYLYPNQPVTTNTPPTAPANLAACWDGATVSFRGSAPADDHTPALNLSYNLRVGTTPGGSQVLRPPANLTNGFNRLAAPGSYQSGSALNGGMRLTHLSAGTPYYWSVQAVDGAYVGGPFSAEKLFTAGASLAVNDTASTNEDLPAALNVMGNDSPTAALFASDPAVHGQTQVSGSQVIYTPNRDYYGPDSFTYYVVNGTGYCTAATVNLTVNVLNDDPPKSMGLDDNKVLENQPVGTAVGTLWGFDPDPGAVLTFSLPAGVKDNDLFSMTGSTIHTKAVFDYETKNQYTIDMMLTDETHQSLTRTFTIQIEDAFDNPPVIYWKNSSGEIIFTRPTLLLPAQPNLTPVKLNLLAGDTEIGDSMSWSVTVAPLHGTLSLTPTTTSIGQVTVLTYTPKAGFWPTGSDSFTVRVTDLAGLTDTALINVKVAQTQIRLPVVQR